MFCEHTCVAGAILFILGDVVDVAGAGKGRGGGGGRGYQYGDDGYSTSTTITTSTTTLSNFGSQMFFEGLMEGEEVTLLEFGPFTMSAECSTTDGRSENSWAIREAVRLSRGGQAEHFAQNVPLARLFLTVDVTSQGEWVYGYSDFEHLTNTNECVGAFPPGTSEKCLVFMAGAGNDQGNLGAFQSLSGYFVGVDGDTTIAFNKDYFNDASVTIYHQYNSNDLAAFPAALICFISGVLKYGYMPQ